MHEKPQLKKHRVNLCLLTPLHIGTGQDFDPFSYVIEGKKLHLIDLVRWMAEFPDRDILGRMMESDNYAAVRTFIAKNIKAKDFTLASVDIDCPKLMTTYHNAIERQDPRNQVLIRPTIRNEINGHPYIPGSSIKGAIRTALANGFVKKAGVTSADDRRNRGMPDYNEKIFGRIMDDPMRWLKIGDVPLDDASSVIMEAQELSHNPDKTPTPKGFFEVIRSSSLTGKAVISPLSFSLAPFLLHGQKVDADYTIDALNRFYVPKFREEYKKFYTLPAAERIRNVLAPVREMIESMKTNTALLRIGHFSHVECVTLDEVRRPITRRDRSGKPLPWGTTRTLANGLHPFGWAMLEFSDLKADMSLPEVTEAGTESLEATGKRSFVGDGAKKPESKPTDLSALKRRFTVKE
jgi:CRISPR-associated protein Csm5